MLRRERNGNQGPSEEGDVETTKKILNNFNYATSNGRSAGDNTIIL
jgi:hypothetical protein